MNTRIAILNHPLAHQVGWALLHSLWQGALIGLVFVVLRFALRRRSASARYVAGCLCLALLLAAPIFTVLVSFGPAPAGEAGAAARAVPAGTGAPAFNAGALGGADAGPAGDALSQWGTDFFGGLAPLLAIGWLLGVSFFSVRLTRSCWQVRSIRITDNEPVDAAWLATLDDLRRRLGVSRPVRLLKSALVEVPTVIGWLRPVILLPATTLSGLTPAQLEAILTHELAHVRRLDYVVNACQCLVETLMFYHPVAWWISRCIREERENCCDDLVIEVCGDRLGYARALATLEGLRAGLPGLAFAASGGSLLNRLRRLLGVSNDSGPTTVREAGGLALLGVGLVLIVLGGRMVLSPTIYQSTARIRIERDQADISGLADQRISPSYDPYFIQTEFELLQSELILGRVIQNLDLNREWGKKYARGAPLKTWETIALLKSKLELRPVRNTSLVEIRVSSDNLDEAARIANAIAEAYKAHRQDQLIGYGKAGIKALEDRFQEQEAKVNTAQQQVSALRVQLNINEVAAGAESPAAMMSAETLRKLEGLRLESKADYIRQLTLLDRLKALRDERGPEGLAQAMPTAAPDPVLNSLLEQLNTTEQKLVGLRKDYGPDHTEVINCKAMAEDLHSKIKSRVEGIMLGLDARVLSLSNSFDNLDKEVEKATLNDVAKADQMRPYFEARRNLEELQRFRQILDMKIANEKLDLQMPKTMMVQIVDMAVPALHPSSPNLGRALALIVFGVLLDLAGLMMLTGWPGARSQPRAA